MSENSPCCDKYDGDLAEVVHFKDDAAADDDDEKANNNDTVFNLSSDNQHSIIKEFNVDEEINVSTDAISVDDIDNEDHNKKRNIKDEHQQEADSNESDLKQLVNRHDHTHFNNSKEAEVRPDNLLQLDAFLDLGEPRRLREVDVVVGVDGFFQVELLERDSGETVEGVEQHRHEALHKSIVVASDVLRPINSQEGDSPTMSHADSQMLRISGQVEEAVTVLDAKVDLFAEEDGLQHVLLVGSKLVDEVHVVGEVEHVPHDMVLLHLLDDLLDVIGGAEDLHVEDHGSEGVLDIFELGKLVVVLGLVQHTLVVKGTENTYEGSDLIFGLEHSLVLCNVDGVIVFSEHERDEHTLPLEVSDESHEHLLRVVEWLGLGGLVELGFDVVEHLHPTGGLWQAVHLLALAVIAVVDKSEATEVEIVVLGDVILRSLGHDRTVVGLAVLLVEQRLFVAFHADSNLNYYER